MSSFKPNFIQKIPQTSGFPSNAQVFNNSNQKPKPFFQSFAGTNPQHTGPGQGFSNINQNQMKSPIFSGASQPRQEFPNNPTANKSAWASSFGSSVVNNPTWAQNFGNASQFTNENMSNQGSFQPNFNKRKRNFDERGPEAQGGNFNQVPRPTRDFPNKAFQGPGPGNPNSTRPTMEIDPKISQGGFRRQQFPSGPKIDFNKTNFTGPGKGNTMEVDPRGSQTSFSGPPGNRRNPEFINQEKGFQAENHESPRKNKFNTQEDPRKKMFNNNQEEPRKRNFNNQERQFSGNFREPQNKPEADEGNQSFQPQRWNREKAFNPSFEMQNPRFQKTQRTQNSQSEKTFRVEGSYSGRISKDEDPYDEEPEFNEEQTKISARNDRFNSGKAMRNEETHSGKFEKNEENTQRFNRGNREDQEQFRKKKTFQARDQAEDQEDEDNTEDLDKLEEQYRKRALASLHRSKSLNKSPATIKIPPRVFPETKRPQFEAKLPKPEKDPQPHPQYREKPKILETEGFKSGNISMCSAEECRSREESKQLSIFERKNSERYECNPQWALKKYLRSSADRQEDKRSAESLTYSLDHLVNNIIDLDTNNNPLNFLLPEDSTSHKFITIYPFVFDRMRAIAKDWKMLQVLASPDLIHDHEIMARFLILSCVEGFYSADFNQNLNQKLVEDLLNCLIRAYEYNREKSIDCDNEPEFTAYFILAKPENLLQIFTLIKSLPEKVLVHPYMRIAINLFKAYHNDDFAGFFATVDEAPYLIACAAYPIFHKFRAISLEKMHFSTFRNLPIEDFVELLYFSNTEEARDYAEFFDLEVETNMVNSNKDVVKVADISDKLAKVFPCVPKNIQMKKAQKKRKDIVLGVDNDFKYGNDEIEEEGLDWGIKEQKIFNEDKEKSDMKKEEDKKNETAKEPKFELKTQLWAENFKNLIEKKHEDKKPIFEDKKDFFPTIFQEPTTKPIKVSPTETKPLFKTSVISDFSLENLIKPVQANQAIAQSPEKKDPEKKISFRFPSDDKTIFSILKDKHLKEKIKENTRNYRLKKKANTKLQLKKCRVFQESRIFTKWKELTKYNKLQNYIYERSKRELQAYESQFSNEIISDSLNYSRFSANKRQKVDEHSYPVLAEEAFVQKFLNKNILSYKLQISSPSQHELFKYTQQKLKGFVGVLAEKNVVVDFSNRSEMACDFIVFIGKSFELHQLRCPFSQNLVAIITDHVNSEDQIKDKLKVYTENEPRIVVLPMIFSVNEFAYYDLIIYPIIEALNKYKPVYGELKLQSLGDIFGVYKRKIEDSDLETQKKLFCLDFNGTFNYWVEFLNRITARIEKKVKQISAVPPTAEALKRWEIDIYDYSRSLKVYEALMFVLKEFYLESLPEINPKDVWNMDMNKIVYAYAGRLASRFERIFGNSFDLLLKLDETFCKFPINVNSKLMYIKGPWFEYFTNILAFFLGLIGKLEKNIVWELGDVHEAVYKTKEFLVDIKEIHEETEARNKSVDFWGSRGFNDRIGEDVFVRELAMHI